MQIEFEFNNKWYHILSKAISRFLQSCQLKLIIPCMNIYIIGGADKGKKDDPCQLKLKSTQ